MILTKILQEILKQDLTFQIMNQRDQNDKVIGLMEDELGEKIMTKFVASREKTCSYLIDDSSEDNKAKDTKYCIKKA